jgi:predicted Zn-dependent protease with MMP-like domain
VEPIAVERFEGYVDDALDQIPDELWQMFDNVAVVVEDISEEEPDLLGVYDGVPLTERDDYGGVLPDRIVIFRLPLCSYARDEADLVEEIRVTVVHELAHHMGIDDDELHEMGYG